MCYTSGTNIPRKASITNIRANKPGNCRAGTNSQCPGQTSRQLEHSRYQDQMSRSNVPQSNSQMSRLQETHLTNFPTFKQSGKSCLYITHNKILTYYICKEFDNTPRLSYGSVGSVREIKLEFMYFGLILSLTTD